MKITYKGKLVIPTKIAMDELSNVNLDLYDAIEILERGFTIRKRRKNIIEKGMQKGKYIFNVVIIEMENYYKLIHAGKFTDSKKFRKLRK